MTTSLNRAGRFHRFLCVILAAAITTAPTASAVAQSNAAAMAVRRQVEGLQGAPGPGGPGPEGPQGPPSQGPPPGPGPGQPPPAEPATGKIDTRYISANAA